MSSDVKSAGQLEALIQRHLAAARIEVLAVPDCAPLQLYLLAQDFPRQVLSADEMHAVMRYPAYWAFCWASGQVMARYLLQQPEWVRGKRVLDFGSGSGVAAIAAAMAGAKRVVACDSDPDARLATATNAALNQVDIQVAAEFDDIGGSFDLILVADVLYDRENLPLLGRFLERAHAVLVADSRVKAFDFPGYRSLGEWESTTLPDLGEFDEFRRVSMYWGQRPT